MSEPAPSNPNQTVSYESVSDTRVGVRGSESGGFVVDSFATGDYDSVGENGGAGRPPTAAPPRLEIPGYEILGLLGRGGMGAVYKARQIDAHRDVALKVMLHAEEPGSPARQRFDTEIRAVARMQHPNIVQLFQVGEVAGRPFFSQEFVVGGSLDRAISKTLPAPRTAAELMITIATAVGYAHRQKIVHRDLKPANILLARPESSPSGADASPLAHCQPKIADFGLARPTEVDDRATRAGTVLGTPSYMAPEQAAGNSDAAGPPADIYALGAILYELLTGRPPFKGSDFWQLLEQVRTVEPVAPRTLQSTVPRDLETICLKCLQKDPTRRYATADALADDLRRYLDGRPIQARPVGPVERTARWCRRNPAPAALIVMLVLAASGSTAAAVTIRGQKREITAQRDKAEGRLKVYRASTYGLVNDVPSVVADHPLAGGMRADILEVVLRLLKDAQGQAAVGSATDWGLQAVAIRSGELAMLNKQFDEADEHFRGARSLAEQAYRVDETERDKAAGNLALAITKRADLALARHRAANQKDDMAAARTHATAAAALYLEAMALRKRVVDEPRTGEVPPEQAEADLGRAHVNLAQGLKAEKKCADALAQARSGQKLLGAAWGKLPAGSRRAEMARRDYGLADVEVGRIAGEVGAGSEARAAYEQAVATFRDLAAAAPRNLGHKINLSIAATEYGDMLLVRLNQPAEAEKWFALAQTQNRALTSTRELVVLQQEGYALGYYRLGVAALKAGRYADAQKPFARCLELRELRVHDLEEETSLPKNAEVIVDAKINRMLAQARCGMAAEAAKTAEGVAKSKQARYRILAACGFALSAAAVTESDPRRAEYLDKALHAAQQAVEAGYSNLEFLETDPDLDPVRAHPKFKAFLESTRATVLKNGPP